MEIRSPGDAKKLGIETVSYTHLPERIFGIFTADEAVRALGAVYLHIMIIHFFSSAFVGAFQAMVTGCGFVSLGFAIGILDGVVCKIGLSLIFVNLMGMGYVGYFLGIGCSRILPGLLCFAYFLSGRWRTRRPVSYTHLDVYKRQPRAGGSRPVGTTQRGI